jgi:hypothetical protein
VPTHERNRYRRGYKSAEHKRTLAADHDEPDPRRDSDRECRQDQRRRALQRVLNRKCGAEATSINQFEKVCR